MAGAALAGGKKNAAAQGRTVIFVDESGFYPLPLAVRTYAPRGTTPLLREWCTHDHLSVISAITPAGKLYVQVQEHALNGADVAAFLQHLLRHIAGPLYVLWDGAPIHRSTAVQRFLAEQAGRVQVERLPPYAPELNPDEGIWGYLKRVELKNLCCMSLAELREALRRAVARLRHKVAVIIGCFKEVGLL